jgi:hypothetical protein
MTILVSSVSIAIRYGPDGPGIKSQWGEFYAVVRTGPGVHPASYTMGTGLFPGLKRPKRGVNTNRHLAPKLNKQYSYISLLLHRAFLRVTNY